MTKSFTLRSMIEDLAARGNAPAIMTVRGEAVETITGSDLARRARQLAQGLLEAGVNPQEPIALFAPNGADWVVARLAIGIAGALAVPIDDLAGDREARVILRDGGVRRVFASPSHVPLLTDREETSSIHALSDEEVGEGRVRSWKELFADNEAPLTNVESSSPSTLLYTSGTTGNPKSFTLTYANIAANIDAILAEDLVGPNDRVLMPLPLHHVYPFVIGMLTPLAAGATIVFPETVTGPHIVRALKAARATVMIGVPRLYTALLSGIESRVAVRGALAEQLFRGMTGLSQRARLAGIRLGPYLFRSLHGQFGPELRLLISGGARLEPREVLRLEALGWEVLSGYGLAETASIFTGNRPGKKRLGSEGKPLGDGQIRIAENEGEDGEIQLKGASVFSGYRNNEEANAEAFTEDGWFRTGDLGHLDEDGYLYVTGRAKELIVLGGGKNVFPEDVEKVYAESPYIQEIAILEKQGSLVALIRPDEAEIRKGGNLNVHDVIRVAVAERSRSLPSYERLAGFALAREPLPRTRLGKYQRFLLPDAYEAALAGRDRPEAKEPSAEDKALLETSPAADLWQLLQRRYADKPLSLDASPQLDLGIDSLEWMTLSLEIDQRLGIALPEEELATVSTVRELLIAADKAAVEGERRPLPVPGKPTPEQARWLEPSGTGQRALALFFYGLNWLLMRALFRVELKGADNLPEHGPFMIAANHVSDLDPPVVAAALPLHVMRRVWWGGNARRLHAGPIRRFVARALHVFPVEERSPASVITLGTAVLERGNILVWFPESWRSPTGELQRFLPGVGSILSNAEVPVVPAFIDGTFEALPRHRKLPKPTKVTVRLGEAVSPRDLAEAGEGEAESNRIAAALRDRVVRLQSRI